MIDLIIEVQTCQIRPDQQVGVPDCQVEAWRRLQATSPSACGYETHRMKFRSVGQHRPQPAHRQGGSRTVDFGIGSAPSSSGNFQGSIPSHCQFDQSKGDLHSHVELPKNGTSKNPSNRGRCQFHGHPMRGTMGYSRGNNVPSYFSRCDGVVSQIYRGFLSFVKSTHLADSHKSQSFQNADLRQERPSQYRSRSDTAMSPHRPWCFPIGVKRSSGNTADQSCRSVLDFLPFLRLSRNSWHINNGVTV